MNVKALTKILLHPTPSLARTYLFNFFALQQIQHLFPPESCTTFADMSVPSAVIVGTAVAAFFGIILTAGAVYGIVSYTKVRRSQRRSNKKKRARRDLESGTAEPAQKEKQTNKAIHLEIPEIIFTPASRQSSVARSIRTPPRTGLERLGSLRLARKTFAQEVFEASPSPSPFALGEEDEQDYDTLSELPFGLKREQAEEMGEATPKRVRLSAGSDVVVPAVAIDGDQTDGNAIRSTPAARRGIPKRDQCLTVPKVAKRASSRRHKCRCGRRSTAARLDTTRW
jgi:hypothetical protein